MYQFCNISCHSDKKESNVWAETEDDKIKID